MATDARIRLINPVSLTVEDKEFYLQNDFLAEPIYFENLFEGKMVVTREYDDVIADLTQYVITTGHELWVEYAHDHGPLEVLNIRGHKDIVRYQHN